MKWIWVIVLAVVGILAAIVAIEYFTVSIHALPSVLGPDHHAHAHGHYRKRGAVAALIAVIAFAAAGYLAYRIRQQQPKTAPSRPADPSASAEQLT